MSSRREAAGKDFKKESPLIFLSSCQADYSVRAYPPLQTI